MTCTLGDWIRHLCPPKLGELLPLTPRRLVSSHPLPAFASPLPVFVVDRPAMADRPPAMADRTATFVDLVIAIILPPLGVFLKVGCEVSFLQSLSLKSAYSESPFRILLDHFDLASMLICNFGFSPGWTIRSSSGSASCSHSSATSRGSSTPSG